MTAQMNFETASQLFDTEVTFRYQNYERFKGTVTERHGTTGDATNVPVSDIIEMSQGNFSPANIPVTPVNETNNQIVPIDFRVKTSIGGGEKTLYAYDKLVDHAKIHAAAAGRNLDYVRLQAIFNSTTLSQLTPFAIPATVGVNTGMNSAKLAAALSQMENNSVNVDDYKVACWLPAITKQAMLADQQVTNIFYNDYKPLTSNKITAYLGTDVRFVGSVGNNKIPIQSGSGTSMSPYLYYGAIVQEDAIVQIFNREVQTSITWVPQEDRWELLTVVTTGAKLIQNNGVVLVGIQAPFAANA